MSVFYLPASDYERAEAALYGPDYSGLDSKYHAEETRRGLSDLYTKGLISESYMRRLWGLDPEVPPR